MKCAGCQEAIRSGERRVEIVLAQHGASQRYWLHARCEVWTFVSTIGRAMPDPEGSQVTITRH